MKQREGYFKRVKAQSQTQFWINNVTVEEAHKAIEAGATGCTQNPAYVWKMIQNPEENDRINGIIQELKKEYSDANEVLIHLQRILIEEIAAVFLPMYEASGHTAGFVSIQSDPTNETYDEIMREALMNIKTYPNIMIKIPVIPEGIEAIETLAHQGVPINATEVMCVRQAMDVCNAYTRATAGVSNYAPIYYSHISGILDEYLVNEVKRQGIDIEEDILWQAGIAAAKKTYEVCNELNNRVGFIGGGARGLHHFTEMVGADASITINWKGTADRLIEEDPIVIQRFQAAVPHSVIDTLSAKIEDFRKAYYPEAIQPEEYHHFGPVVLFRDAFVSAWESARDYIQELS